MKSFSSINILFSLFLITAIFSLPSWAQDTVTLKAKITNVSGQPLQGVKVYIYESTNVRKPADFITGTSDSQGSISAVIPPGKYWAVARLKNDGLYGPLMPGDKHSGEPMQLEITSDVPLSADFVVADIQEMGQKKRTDSALTRKIQGRILNAEGKPVAGAFAYACNSREFEAVPEYVSISTDESGLYTLLVPIEGRLFVGSSTTLIISPDNKKNIREIADKPGKSDIAMDIQLIVY